MRDSQVHLMLDTVRVALSPAERQVARLAAAGLPNAEIARSRGSAVRTVANQIASAFRKLGVRSRLELWALVAREGSRVGAELRPDPVRIGASSGGDGESCLGALTSRQRAVLAYAAMGHQNKLIGHLLGLSASAVSFHLESIRQKLGLASRAELVWRFAPLLDAGGALGPPRPVEAGLQRMTVSNATGGGSAPVPSPVAVQRPSPAACR